MDGGLLAELDAQMPGTPARLPALCEVNSILGQLIDVDSEGSLRCVAGSKRVIDQLKVGATGLAKSLGLQ